MFMEKLLPCTANLYQSTIPLSSSHRIEGPKQAKPTFGNRISKPEKARSFGIRVEQKKMDTWDGRKRVPLSKVVEDLEKAWFQEALEVALSATIAMQVLVGQMYCRGYGVAKDVDKGLSWIKQASQSQPWVLEVAHKHPGCFSLFDSSRDFCLWIRKELLSIDRQPLLY